MTRDEKRARVLSYLYGEMTPEETTAFRSAVERDPELRILLAEEEKLNQLYPVGSGPQAPETLLQESRVLLRAALRQESRKTSLLVWLADLFRRAPQWAYAGGVLAALLIGVFLGRTALQPETSSLAGLIKPDGLEVVALRVTRFEPATGRISLAFDAISSAEVEGTLQDRDVQTVLATALQGDLESGARLQAVELAQGQTGSAQIRQALIHTLAHDDNPGVRLKAIEALKDLAKNEEVRQALRQALQHDLNPGVRVEAIEVLKGFSDPATLQVLEKQSRDDVNTYIRAEAGRAVQKWSTASSEQL